MKMAREPERPVREKEKRRGPSAAAGLEFTETEERLFMSLRGLRTEIARREHVPPYIVFSDKTLTHMCVVKPGDREEMMTVSGVGEHKFEKYGEAFLDCIRRELAREDG